MHAVALAHGARHQEGGRSRARADVFSAWGMLMSDLRRDYFVTRLIDAATRRTRRRLDALLERRDRDARSGSSRARASRREQVRFLRYGKLPLPEPGAQRRGAASRTARSTRRAIATIAETLPRLYEREYTYRLDAPVELVGAAPRRDRRGRQARAGAAAGDRAVARRRASRAAATSTTRPRASTRRDDLRRRAARAGHELRRPGDHRDERAPRSSSTRATELTVDDYGNLIISIALDGNGGDAVTTTRPHDRSDHARDHPELAAGDQRRDVRRDAQDGDERDHLRGARHGHRHHRRRGRARRPPAPASRPSSACSTRR